MGENFERTGVMKVDPRNGGSCVLEDIAIEKLAKSLESLVDCESHCTVRNAQTA